MPRLLDLECQKCGEVVRDVFVRQVPDRILHFGDDGSCMGKMEQVLLPNATRQAGWSDKDAVVVFRKPDGSISYPGRNDAATPKGCERVVMKSLRDVERFEKQHGVRCEAMHFNSGNGMQLIDHVDAGPSLKERQDAFLRAWHGQ